ncbi:MAG TPA: ribokinase [Alphaproteobacteria bacterium]|nr:ribokinase [Alphaproteobacteria bacterium]
MTAGHRIAVAGSVNLDIVARCARLPLAGETVTDATLARYPGGKGANQALAARRLGAEVTLIASVGADPAAEEALALLKAEGVDLSHLHVAADLPTGTALIAVSAAGENQIVVAPGANRALTPDRLTIPPCDALIAQMEIPIETVARVAQRQSCRVVINMAPARPAPDVIFQCADLLIVNETEELFYGDALHTGPGLVCMTLGARGAQMFRKGRKVGQARAPSVTPVDTTGAGDAFVAAVTVALLEGMTEADALAFACAAGAAATLKAGAQPSLPTREEIRRLLRP